ncbi:MAG: hypothetical protein WD605_01295 [Candidatus Paceibacterota bacterium]
MKFLTKWSLLSLLIVSAAGFLSLHILGVYELCTENGVRSWECTEYLGNIKTYLLFLALYLLPLIITLPFRPVVFEAWKKFAVWAVPILVIITIALASIETSSGIGGGVEQMMILYAIIGLYVLYLITSLIIIARTWLRNRSK